MSLSGILLGIFVQSSCDRPRCNEDLALVNTFTLLRVWLIGSLTTIGGIPTYIYRLGNVYIIFTNQLVFVACLVHFHRIFSFFAFHMELVKWHLEPNTIPISRPKSDSMPCQVPKRGEPTLIYSVVLRLFVFIMMYAHAVKSLNILIVGFVKNGEIDMKFAAKLASHIVPVDKAV